MKTIRRILFLFAALCLALPLCACGGDPAPASTQKTAPAEPGTEPESDPAPADPDYDATLKGEAEVKAYFADFEEEVFYVGATREHKSLVSLLLDLKNDRKKKTIYIDEGTYDLFAEYRAELYTGRIVTPPDTIASGTYFSPYNAFVPDNTRVVGVGEVTLQFTPKSNEISYGASRTWSPLNVLGNAMIENIRVLGKNCRYCLHNDDHNKYPGAYQYYKNVRMEYQLSDILSDGRRLGFNNTVGYGINTDSVHLYEDCEIYFNGDGNHSAFYGHDPSTNQGEGLIYLKNCHIYASDETNNRVIRLQTLSRGTAGHVITTIENCRVNGGLTLHLYYEDSVQSYAVTFRGTEKMKVNPLVASGGTFRNPYLVKSVD